MSSFWKKHTPHIVLMIVLIGIAIVGWNIEIPTQVPTGDKQIAIETTASISSTNTDDLILQYQENDEFVYTSVDKFDNKDVSIITATVQNTITIATSSDEVVIPSLENTLLISGQRYTQPYIPGSSVYDFMTLLKQGENFSFKTRYYGSSLGYFVTQINGMKNDDEPGFFWIYYVNGKKATIGISNYILKPSDVTEWKYEESEL